MFPSRSCQHRILILRPPAAPFTVLACLRLGFNSTSGAKNDCNHLSKQAADLSISRTRFQTSLGKQFNFTFDFGGGIQLFTKNHNAVTLGYKYDHISNAYRGQINPGFDSNVFYVGFSFFK